MTVVSAAKLNILFVILIWKPNSGLGANGEVDYQSSSFCTMIGGTFKGQDSAAHDADTIRTSPHGPPNLGKIIWYVLKKKLSYFMI